MPDSFVSRDGSRWLPEYLSQIGASCIGCGRCFKVCSR
ncbi:ferredoxin, partial [Rhizobium ruizarguesonis]